MADRPSTPLARIDDRVQVARVLKAAVEGAEWKHVTTQCGGSHVDGHRACDGGFTLIELLVVMIIIGTLAAIAIPTFLTQRAKAHDAATKADVSSLGKEIATYFVGGTGPLTLDFTTNPGYVDISDATGTTQARLTVGSTAPATGASSGLDQPQGWCVALTDPQGSTKTFKYSALDGLARGACP